MILRCEINLKLGDAWTAYDRMAAADALIRKIKYVLHQGCEKSKGEMELLSIQGEIAPESKGDISLFVPSDSSCSPSNPLV